MALTDVAEQLSCSDVLRLALSAPSKLVVSGQLAQLLARWPQSLREEGSLSRARVLVQAVVGTLSCQLLPSGRVGRHTLQVTSLLKGGGLGQRTAEGPS